jgi:hypothetical protein
MRTKTLLLTAALSAAGIATSMAQVYSVNAVGYVNTTLVPGFNLISNPLNNTAGNTVQNLFGTGIQGTIPPGLTVYVFKNGAYITPAQYDELDGAFTPAASAAEVIAPGTGVFVRNPTTANVTVTFVGEVPQGDLSVPLPAGFSIVASPVPQEGTATALGLTGNEGDTIYQFNEATQNYNTPSTYDALDQAFSPALQPLAVGEAFFFLNRGAARTWNRTFDVNAPQG